MESYEQARNRGLEILKDINWASGQPMIGKFKEAHGKIVGRKWHDGKVTLRLDYDPKKGPHINITDYRNGNGVDGIAVAIPFEGTQEMFNSLLGHLQ